VVLLNWSLSHTSGSVALAAINCLSMSYLSYHWFLINGKHRLCIVIQYIFIYTIQQPSRVHVRFPDHPTSKSPRIGKPPSACILAPLAPPMGQPPAAATCKLPLAARCQSSRATHASRALHREVALHPSIVSDQSLPLSLQAHPSQTPAPECRLQAGCGWVAMLLSLRAQNQIQISQ
jgi:hypothetical protein